MENYDELLNNLFNSFTEVDTSDINELKDFLVDQGVDPNILVREGLAQIKKFQLKAEIEMGKDASSCNETNDNNWAIAARDGSYITSEVKNQMKIDKENAMNSDK